MVFIGRTNFSDRFGVLAGGGQLPDLVVNQLNRQDHDVVVAAIAGADPETLEESVVEYRQFPPESFGDVPEYLLDNGVRDLVMVGSVDRTLLYEDERYEEADEMVRSGLSTMESHNDENLMETAVDLLEAFDLKVRSIDSVMESKLTPEGHQCGPEPDERSMATLEELSEVAMILADCEVGQTVLGKRQSVVAVEAAEGTNSTIRRAGRLAGDGLVMIKVARTDQDFRLDVPVVGSSTVRELVDVDADLLAFEAGRTLWVQRRECREISEEHNLTLLGWRRDGAVES